jgi:ferredoxin/flavodoxin---NADP+ reductase
MVERPIHRVHHVRSLSQSAYVLRFDRHGLPFEPGQYVNVGLRGSIAAREYSIYSGSGDDFLEVLIREVAGGLVSRALRRCEPGDALSVEGPYGSFVTDPGERGAARYLFVGSGTGISPFHCLVRSYPGIDYLLLHGVRTEQECFDADAFPPSRYVSCVSRTAGGSYRGRVTRYLREHPVDPACLCYLCGNSDMIYDSYAILRDQGVALGHLRAEIYF